MNPIIRFTFLAFEINHLIDSGKKLDIEVTKTHIKDGSLFDWLKETFDNIDLSLYKDEDKTAIFIVFRPLVESVDNGRKFGVENEGLNLLLAYCIEGLQQLRHQEGNYN